MGSGLPHEPEKRSLVLASDNWAGAAPEVMAAVVRANEGPAAPYGGDPLTRRVEERLAEVFETDCAVYLTSTGTASNGLALATLTPPYGLILCHEASHVYLEEAGGPEFFTGGARLLPLPGAGGKLTPETVRRTLAGLPPYRPHAAPAAALTLTQGTEAGTLYSVDELGALCQAAHGAGLAVHVDGARFANAVAASGASPAELTWKAGVDVLSLGATKNGCLAAEAVVYFDRGRAADFEYRRKRAGHLWSKMRFLAAQLDAWLEGGLWLRLARHANARAQRLSAGLAGLEGVEICHATQINEVFVRFPAGVAERLEEAGAHFYPWVTPGDPVEGGMSRLVTSFRTTDEEVDAFLDLVRESLPRG